MEFLVVLSLAFASSLSFTMVSRSRNRSHFVYHMIASVGSNTLWFFTFRQLVMQNMTAALVMPFVAGTTFGSLAGAWVSMKVERWLGAASDSHLEKINE